MQYTLKEKKPLPKSEYLLVVEIPAEEVVHEQAHVLEHLKKDAEFPGFRKGFVPEKMIRERTGEMELWEEAASHALSHVLAKVFRADKLDVIGRPHVEVVKLSPANPAEFKVTLSLYPSLSLPDYKKISSEHNGKKPESADIEETDSCNRAAMYQPEVSAKETSRFLSRSTTSRSPMRANSGMMISG